MSSIQKRIPEPYSWMEEQVLINRGDITSNKDAWDMQEFIKRTYIKQLLRHPVFQFLLAMLLLTNAITIALRTNPVLGQKHYELFSIIDDIVLTILFCELLLGWLNGFWIFWKDAWNILNFFIIAILILSSCIEQLSFEFITCTLRVLRLVHVCMAVEPLARIINVILQSVPGMLNVMALILFFMLVFSVFGVTLFGAFMPQHFQNMKVALYSLFICITQDGWVDIYIDFQMPEEYTMEIGAAIYFAIFITIGAFIGINLLIVVVTTNLELMMKKEDRGKQQKLIFGENDQEENKDLPLVHCLVAREEKSSHPQEPLARGTLSNLSETTCDNFCLVLEAIQQNLKQYKELRDELDKLVDEVRSIRFNQEQQEEILNRAVSTNLLVESGLSMDLQERKQDLLSTLLNMEKVQESSTNILYVKRKSMF
ncbi:cation channel sperm-associated protein 4 [Tenrec ecaudatus]|uniref:cation channel sperm-associated protein 4 n=1 Tax=Tenrec ecaudatus TaxID=94439 RepID=UPI003F592223